MMKKMLKMFLNLHREMVLRENDIVNFKVNWKDKSKNIIEISKELDLGLESFLVWDDNPIERKKLKII